MRKSRFVLFGVMTASLAAVTAPSAQQSDNARRQPKQTQDRGFDEAIPPGQERKIGERNVAGVAIEARPDGTLVARLDESFHDAIVATKKSDGTTSYVCLHGFSAANRAAVKGHPPVTPKSSSPVLEEK